MQAIGSSDSYYNVYVRGMEKPVRMSANGGKALSDYLVGDDVKQFVTIKDTRGIERVFRTNTIDRVEEYTSTATVSKSWESLSLPDLVGEDYEERIWR